MKTLKKLVYALSAVMMLFLLTACGGQVNTELTIDTNQSGTRIMTYTANKNDNKSYFTGDYESAANTVSSNCPAELQFTDKSTDEDVIYEFKMTFSDMDEYKGKINSLLQQSGRDELDEPFTFVAPDSVFATGVRYNENFNSEQLLGWFENLVVDSGYVAENNKSNIFYSSQTGTWNVLGSKSEGSTPYIDTIKYLRLDGVSLYTTVNNDGTYDRKIEVRVPQVSMDSNGDDIKNYLDSVTAAPASGEWNEEGGVHTYTLEVKGASASTVNEVMNVFSGKNGETLFEEAVVGEGEDEAESERVKNIFSDSKRVKETVSLGNYATGSYNELRLSYYVSNVGEYEGKATVGDSTNSISTSQTEIEGFDKLYNTNYGNDFSLDYTYTYKYTVSEAEIVLKPQRGGKVTREVTLAFLDGLTDAQLSSLKDRIQAAIDETNAYFEDGTNKAEIILKKCEAGKDGLDIVIKTEADSAVEEELWNRAFGGHSLLVVTRDTNALLPTSVITNVKDVFDLSMFTDVKISKLTYTIKGIGKLAGSDVDEETQKGNDYEKTYTNYSPRDYLRTDVIGKKSNFLGVLVWILSGLAALATVICIIVIAAKKAAAKRPAQPYQVQPAAGPIQPAAGQEQVAPIQPMPGQPMPVQPTAGPIQPTAGPGQPVTQPMQQPMQPVQPAAEPATVFCSNCGAKIPADSVFCPECGSKAE